VRKCDGASVAAGRAQCANQSLPVLGLHDEHHEAAAAGARNLAGKRAVSRGELLIFFDRAG
jgi:hypothetical protein